MQDSGLIYILAYQYLSGVGKSLTGKLTGLKSYRVTANRIKYRIVYNGTTPKFFVECSLKTSPSAFFQNQMNFEGATLNILPKEISVNRKDEKKVEYKGYYPDMVLGNHGMVLAILEVETVETISEKKAESWKALSDLGVKLILMIPKEMKVKVTDLRR
ncbi:MAG: hypothetical protein Q8P40_07730 [Nitrospirota bacterium]|nr:hypothetical protein [Nitrospirota bacterium]